MDKQFIRPTLMSRILGLIFMTTVFNIFSCSAEERKSICKTQKGNEFFFVKNTEGKWGVVDSNDNLVVPYKYQRCESEINPPYAYMMMWEKDDNESPMTVYNLDGEIVIDPSKGYYNIYSNYWKGFPGYTVVTSEGKGILNSRYNEIIPPKYDTISSVKFGDYYVIATNKKSDRDIYNICGVLMDKNGNSGVAPISGKAVFFKDLNLTSKEIKNYNDHAELWNAYRKRTEEITPDYCFDPKDIAFFVIVNNDDVPKDEYYFPNAFFWQIYDHENLFIEKPYQIEANNELNNFAMPLENVIIDNKEDLVIKAKNTNEFIQFKITNSNIENQIIFNIDNVKPYIYIPYLFGLSIDFISNEPNFGYYDDATQLTYSLKEIIKEYQSKLSK